jgi:hypothetical protein
MHLLPDCCRPKTLAFAQFKQRMASTGCDQIKPHAASTSQMPILNSSIVEYGEAVFEMIQASAT